MHRDDSDDDDNIDDDIDDSADGWEDELGRRVFPEENEQQSAEGAEESSEADYWTENEQDELEEDREAYYGFARQDPSTYPPSRSQQTGERQMSSCGANVSLAAASTNREVDDDTVSAARVSFNCPLCLEVPKDTSATRCGHVFCTP